MMFNIVDIYIYSPCAPYFKFLLDELAGSFGKHAERVAAQVRASLINYNNF